jgi:hypothetical protein
VNVFIEDILAGRPVVYADFLGYDEVAHHSGIERFDALAVLRGIDRQIGRLRARVERAGVNRSVRREPSGEVARVAPGVVVVVSGHVAMVSFTDHEGRVPLETIEREFPELLPQLVDHPGVGFMLVRSSEFGPHAAEKIRRTDTFPHGADVMINSRYDPETDNASPFEPHVGSHGGMGGPQERAFLVYPKQFAHPGEVVGAEALHHVFRDWLTDLGHPVPGSAHDTPDDLGEMPGLDVGGELAQQTRPAGGAHGVGTVGVREQGGDG